MRRIFFLLIALCSVASAEPLFQDRFEVGMSKYLAAANNNGLFVFENGVNLTQVFSDPDADDRIVAFNSQGSVLAYEVANFSVLTLLRVGEWTVEDTATLDLAIPTKMLFTPDDNYLVVSGIDSGDDAPLSVFNADDLTIAHRPTSQGYRAEYGMDVSPDSSMIALGMDVSPYLKIINVGSWTEVSLPEGIASEEVNALSFSKDGQYLFIGFVNSPYLKTLRTSDWSEVTTGISVGAEVELIESTVDRVVISYAGGIFSVYSIGSWVEEWTPSGSFDYWAMAVDKDQKTLAAGRFGAVDRWDIESQVQLNGQGINNHTNGVSFGGKAAALLMGVFP